MVSFPLAAVARVMALLGQQPRTDLVSLSAAELMKPFPPEAPDEPLAKCVALDLSADVNQ